MWPQQLYKSMMDIQPDSTMEFPDVILIVLFHNDFSLSSEQPQERVLTPTLWQPTFGCIAIFQILLLYKT